MNKFLSDDPVLYLTRRKFPEYKRVYASQGHDPQRTQIEAYQAELRLKPREELQALQESEKAKEQREQQLFAEAEERGRFFNLPSANADFVHWSKAAHWTLDEAIALAFGKAPEVVRWEQVQKFVPESPFATKYARVRDLALRAKLWNQLYDPVVPSIFLAWARRTELDVPAELIQQVEKRGIVIADWKDLYDKLKSKFEELMRVLEQNNQTNESLIKQREVLQARMKELESQLESAWDGFDENADNYPKELDIALQAWTAASKDRDQSKTVKLQITSWLEQHYPRLSDEAKQRIATVCNWEKEGGRRRRNV